LSEEQVDACSVEGFKKLLEENPKLLLLVTEKDCTQCPTLREAAYTISEEKEIPLAEMEFKEGKAVECAALPYDLRKAAEAGVIVMYKEGKEVGRAKATGFKEWDEKAIRELLEK